LSCTFSHFLIFYSKKIRASISDVFDEQIWFTISHDKKNIDKKVLHLNQS
jgi:hypothetical protein